MSAAMTMPERMRWLAAIIGDTPIHEVRIREHLTVIEITLSRGDQSCCVTVDALFSHPDGERHVVTLALAAVSP